MSARTFLADILRAKTSKPAAEGGGPAPVDASAEDVLADLASEAARPEDAQAQAEQNHAPDDGLTAEERAPLTMRWFEVAQRYETRRRERPGESQAKSAEAIGAEFGASGTYVTQFVGALKGQVRAMARDPEVGRALTKVSHVVAYGIARWPEDTFDEALERVREHLDGRLDAAYFKSLLTTNPRSYAPAGAEGRTDAGATEAPAQVADDAFEDVELDIDWDLGEIGLSPSKGEEDQVEPNSLITQGRWITTGLALLKSLNEDPDFAPETIMLSAYINDATEEDVKALAEAARGNLRVRALDEGLANALEELDPRASALLAEWPDQRMAEAMAIARGVVDGTVALSDLERATDAVARWASAAAAEAEEDAARAADLVHTANLKIADPWRDREEDYFIWQAIRETIEKIKAKERLTLVPQREPDEFAIDGEKGLRGWLTIIRPELSDKEAAKARRNALAKTAIETYDRKRRSFSVVAMPSGPGVDELSEMAREKNITALNILVLTRVYTYDAHVVRPTDKK